LDRDGDAVGPTVDKHDRDEESTTLADSSKTSIDEQDRDGESTTFLGSSRTNIDFEELAAENDTTVSSRSNMACLGTPEEDIAHTREPSHTSDIGPDDDERGLQRRSAKLRAAPQPQLSQIEVGRQG